MKYLLVIVLIVAAVILLLNTTKERKKEFDRGMEALDNANDTALNLQLNTLVTAVQNYRSEQGRFPASLESLSPQYIGNTGAYLDPWGTHMQLRPEDAQSVTLLCAGPDCSFDTADDIRRKIE